jgi:DNA-binding response OmpR family regulator
MEASKRMSASGATSTESETRVQRDRAFEVQRASSDPTAPGTQSPEVLVVDDDADTLDAVAEALEMEGIVVRRASSGREALRLAALHPPQLAIVDLIMPEVSGEDVCTELRRDPRFAATRLLVLSAAEDTRLVAASCDADGAIMKPFTTALLLHEVRRLLS